MAVRAHAVPTEDPVLGPSIYTNAQLHIGTHMVHIHKMQANNPTYAQSFKENSRCLKLCPRTHFHILPAIILFSRGDEWGRLEKLHLILRL